MLAPLSTLLPFAAMNTPLPVSTQPSPVSLLSSPVPGPPQQPDTPEGKTDSYRLR